MNYLKSVYNYNSSLKNQILKEIIAIANRANLKKTYLCKPNNQFEVITSNELNVLITKYTKKCFQYFSLAEEREKIKGMLRVDSSFDEFRYLIYSLWYANLIELKNKENFKDLEKLYTSSFLINYSSKIHIKDRSNHSFNLENYKKFYDEIYESFIKGIVPPSITDGVTTLDHSSIYIDMMGLNGLFWKYCSINAIFEMVEQSLDLTRYLHDLFNDAKAINSKLFNNQKPLVDIKKVASAGGKAKANNYLALMNPIFDDAYNLFQTTNPLTGKKWKTKSECARHFIREFYKKCPDTNIDLDYKKLVAEITIRINNQSTSKKVTLLADKSTS